MLNIFNIQLFIFIIYIKYVDNYIFKFNFGAAGSGVEPASSLPARNLSVGRFSI